MSHIVSIKQVSSKQADCLQRLHTADNVASGQKIWTKDCIAGGGFHTTRKVCFFFLGDRGSYLLHCCLGPPIKYTVQTTCSISIGSSVLAQLMDKQIHTDHGASVTLRCIFALHACDWCGLQCFDAVSIGIWSINTEWWVATTTTTTTV